MILVLVAVISVSNSFCHASDGITVDHAAILSPCDGVLFKPNKDVEYLVQSNGHYWQAMNTEQVVTLTSDSNATGTLWKFVPALSTNSWHIVNAMTGARVTIGTMYLDLNTSLNGDPANFSAMCVNGKSAMKLQISNDSRLLPHCKNPKCNKERVCYKNNGGCSCGEMGQCVAGSTIWLSEFGYEERHECTRNPKHCDDRYGSDWYEITSWKCRPCCRRRVCGRTKNPDTLDTSRYSAVTWFVEPVRYEFPLDFNAKIGHHATSLRHLDEKNFGSVLEMNYHLMLSHLSQAQQNEATLEKVLKDTYNYLHTGFTPIAPVGKNLDVSPTTKPRFFSDISVHSSKVLVSTECAEAIGSAVFQVVMLFITLAGMEEAAAERVAREYSRLLPFDESLSGIQLELYNLSQTTGKWEQFKKMAALFGETYRLLGGKALLQAMYNQLHWYDYITSGLIVVSQLVLWFGTDGEAFYAEMFLMAVTFDEIAKAALNVNEKCQ